MTNQQTTPEPTVEARRQEIVRLMNRTLIRDCLAIGAIIDEMLRDKDAAIEALRAERVSTVRVKRAPGMFEGCRRGDTAHSGDERDRSTNRAYG